MRKKDIIFCIASFFVMLIFGFVSAQYTLGSPNHSIQTTYEPGAGIDGWINIQFSNESNFSVFKDSEGNSMTLIELLNENPDYSYSVNATYGTIDSATMQHLNIDKDVFKLSNDLGQKTYQFNFSNNEIFSEQITVALATSNLNEILLLKMSKLNSLKEQIKTFDSFEQLSINSALNISYLESELNSISADYLTASTQAELDNLSARLSLIDVPDRIEITKIAPSIPTFPISSNINLDAISNITNSSYESNKTQEYKNAVTGWNFNNLDTKISFKEFTAVYTDYEKNIISTFNLSFNKKGTIDYPVNIFLKKASNMLFQEDYQKTEQEDYFVFQMTGVSKNIGFSTSDTNVNFTNLEFFASPSLEKLSVKDFEYIKGKKDEAKKFEQKKWIIFSLVMLLVFILGLILYLVLQTWYKKRYEEYLFPNKNDLYNLAVYITNSKKRGLDNEQIKENLKQSKWSSEQIRYALRKYSGKRTGMYEIALRKKLDRETQTGYPRYK